jgi:hypothetical protein
MTKRPAILLGILCLCITLVFGAYWRSHRGAWQERRIWEAAYTGQTCGPVEVIVDEDGEIVEFRTRDPETLLGRLKRLLLGLER